MAYLWDEKITFTYTPHNPLWKVHACNFGRDDVAMMKPSLTTCTCTSPSRLEVVQGNV